MANAIFGSPTRHPIQDKKTVLTKNGILKITAGKDRDREWQALPATSSFA